MNAATLLAEAAEAEREATAIFDAMHEARNEPGAGDRYIPNGWGARAQQASDLMRHARSLRADAAEFTLDSVPPPVAAAPAARPPAPPAPSAPAPSPSTVVGVPSIAPTAVETAETIAARILAADIADSVAGVGASVFHAPSAAETEMAEIEKIASRILASDSDSAVPEVAYAPVVVGPGTAEDPVRRIAERIFNA